MDARTSQAVVPEEHTTTTKRRNEYVNVLKQLSKRSATRLERPNLIPRKIGFDNARKAPAAHTSKLKGEHSSQAAQKRQQSGCVFPAQSIAQLMAHLVNHVFQPRGAAVVKEPVALSNSAQRRRIEQPISRFIRQLYVVRAGGRELRPVVAIHATTLLEHLASATYERRFNPRPRFSPRPRFNL
jgi:hypothetical protein